MHAHSYFILKLEFYLVNIKYISELQRVKEQACCFSTDVPIIPSPNQCTGFYMIGTSVMKELMKHENQKGKELEGNSLENYLKMSLVKPKILNRVI